MAPDPQENVVKSSENIEEKAPIPLSEYANKLEPKVKKRYVEKIRLLEYIHSTGNDHQNKSMIIQLLES